MTRKSAPTPPEPQFRPFADDSAVQSFGDLSFENGTRRIALHGSLDLTRDRSGLERARGLKGVVDGIVAALEAQDLPDIVAEDMPTSASVKNPFA